MKVLVLGFTSIKYMPYLRFYLEDDAFTNNDIHIVKWIRDDESEIDPDGVTLHVFKARQKDEIAKIRKLKNFYNYRKFVKDLLHREAFDKVICLSTIPGVLLKDELIHKFKNNYIFDYRDYTFEAYGFYKKWVGELVHDSFCTFTSSKGFFRFLPKSAKIQQIHNLLYEPDKLKDPAKHADTFHIGYWGLIRHYDANIRFIRCFANDRRFFLNYYGRMEETAFRLKRYCEENHINNVQFHGAYLPDDRYEFFAKTDIIHNYYENDLQTIGTMGNKFYDAVIAKLPQICNEGSFMAEEMHRYRLGLGCKENFETFADEVYNYLIDLNHEELDLNCERYLSRVLHEQRQCYEKLHEFLK